MESHRLICVEKHTMNTFLYLKDIDRSIDLYHQHVQPSNRQNVPSLQKRIHILATSATQSIPSPRHNDTFVKVIWLLQNSKMRLRKSRFSQYYTIDWTSLRLKSTCIFIFGVYIYIFFFWYIFIYVYVYVVAKPSTFTSTSSVHLPANARYPPIALVSHVFTNIFKAHYALKILEGKDYYQVNYRITTNDD